MPKLYELEIPDNVINDLPDIDGEIDALRFLDACPNKMTKAIEDVVNIYDRTAWGIFHDFFYWKKQPLAWAHVFLDRENWSAPFEWSTLNVSA